MKTKYLNPYYLKLVILTASLGGFLFGFDMAVISGVLPFVSKQFVLSPAQEGWFVSSALLGCVIGVALTGELSDRLGRKKILFIAAVLFLISAVFCVISGSFTILIWARIFSGFGVGIASIVVPLYLSEIAPTQKRGQLVTYYQLAITIGILVAYLSNAAVLKYSTGHPHSADEMGISWIFIDEIWRGMFFMGILPAVLFLIGVFFIPESPRWLTNKGKLERGLKVWEKINGALEFPVFPASESTDGAYKQLFSKRLRRPLLIGIMLPLFSQLCGINAIIYYGPKILSDAGISMSNSLLGQIVFGTANLLFTFIAIWKVDKLGRRKLYITGSIGAFVSLVLTGIFINSPDQATWALLSCTLIFLACFAFSIGPLKFVVISEIFPASIRGRAMAISIMVMWVSDTLVGQLTPLMLAGFGTAGTFWFFSIFCLLAFIFTYRYLPETKGKSLEEIEAFWKS